MPIDKSCASWEAAVAGAQTFLAQIPKDIAKIPNPTDTQVQLGYLLQDLGNFYFNQTTDFKYKSPEFQGNMMTTGTSSLPRGYLQDYNNACLAGSAAVLQPHPFHSFMKKMTALNASPPFNLKDCKAVATPTVGSCHKCYEGIDYTTTPVTFAFKENYSLILAAIKATAPGTKINYSAVLKQLTSDSAQVVTQLRIPGLTQAQIVTLGVINTYFASASSILGGPSPLALADANTALSKTFSAITDKGFVALPLSTIALADASGTATWTNESDYKSAIQGIKPSGPTPSCNNPGIRDFSTDLSMTKVTNLKLPCGLTNLILKLPTGATKGDQFILDLSLCNVIAAANLSVVSKLDPTKSKACFKAPTGATAPSVIAYLSGLHWNTC